MAELVDWNVAAASNNSASPDGFPEGMAPSGINDAARETMAVVARWYGDNNAALSSAGAANAYTLTLNATIAAYAAGQVYMFIANHAAGGAATLDVDGVGAKAIKKKHDQAIEAGDIEQNQIVIVAYKATEDVFQLLTPTAIENTVDINGGTIDGATIGATSATTIVGTTIDATTDFTIGGTVITDNTITDDGTLVIAATTAVSFSDKNITNVGDIALDSVSSDGAAAALTITATAGQAVAVEGVDFDGGTIGAFTAAGAIDFGDQNMTNVDIDSGAIDGVTIGGAAAPTVTDLGSVATCDINGGTIDGAAIGGASAAAGSFTTLNTSGAVIFNDAGADVDFRVESDAAANAFFIDGASGNVGIGVIPNSGWGSDFIATQESTGAIWASRTVSNSANFVISENTYFDNTNRKAIVTDSAGASELRVGGGGFFFRTSDGAVTQDVAFTPLDALTIDNSANVYGTTGTTAMTDGFVFIPAAAGAPSGAVAVTTATLAAMYYDTTNKKFYVYNHVANAWEGVVLA